MPGDGGRPRPATASGKIGGVAQRISSPVLAGRATELEHIYGWLE